MFTVDVVRQGHCDAAFLSSSPFDMLPIRTIEDLELNSAENPLFHRINAAYQDIVDQYIEENCPQAFVTNKPARHRLSVGQQ